MLTVFASCQRSDTLRGKREVPRESGTLAVVSQPEGTGDRHGARMTQIRASRRARDCRLRYPHPRPRRRRDFTARRLLHLRAALAHREPALRGRPVAPARVPRRNATTRGRRRSSGLRGARAARLPRNRAVMAAITKHGKEACRARTLPAGALEDFVAQRITRSCLCKTRR